MIPIPVPITMHRMLAMIPTSMLTRVAVPRFNNSGTQSTVLLPRMLLGTAPSSTRIVLDRDTGMSITAPECSSGQCTSEVFSISNGQGTRGMAVGSSHAPGMPPSMSLVLGSSSTATSEGQRPQRRTGDRAMSSDSA